MIPVSITGWPPLLAGVSYWVALAPGKALAANDGALWSGFDFNFAQTPPFMRANPQFFTARELRVPGGCANAAAITAVQNTPNWSSTGSRYTDWNAAGSNWRYGLQVIGTANVVRGPN